MNGEFWYITNLNIHIVISYVLNIFKVEYFLFVNQLKYKINIIVILDVGCIYMLHLHSCI